MLVPVFVSGGAKADKATALRRRHPFRQIGTFLRCAEALAVLVLLSWSSSRLPDAFRLFVVSLRRLASLVLSTPFVFLLGNAIVLTLFAKSKRQQPCDLAAPCPDQHSICDDLLRVVADVPSNDNPRTIPRPEVQPAVPGAAAEVAYENRAICAVADKPDRRRFRRTKSEHMNDKRGDEIGTKKLRRTSTDVAGKEDGDDWVGALAGTETEEEERRRMLKMSDEELRRRMEAFIAKEMRFRRLESIAMVVADGCNDRPQAAQGRE